MTASRGFGGGPTPHTPPDEWTTAQLRALDGIPIGAEDVVHVFVSLDGAPDAADEALLDEEERQRAVRFVHARHRARFTLAHAALRLFVARCLGVEPAAVRYVAGRHGKPRLPRTFPPLEFNLSHAESVCLLAAARERAVGVDVELVRELPDAASLAAAHFSATERDALRSLPAPERRSAFFRCWTRKEAVLKADGEGLGHALDRVDVGLEGAASVRLPRPGETREWSVVDLPAPSEYAAAGAVASSADHPIGWRPLSLSL
jgi:4'-phosphopantetheinyl transferase